MQKNEKDMQGMNKVEKETEEKRKLNIFDKFLSLWVALSISLGTVAGYSFPKTAATLGGFEIANVSIPVAVVLLIMMYPLMLKISFNKRHVTQPNRYPQAGEPKQNDKFAIKNMEIESHRTNYTFSFCQHAKCRPEKTKRVILFQLSKIESIFEI